ncbi:hypothetical protein EW026_g1969 [Hermanssonia centrifuga]|uniref:DNAJ-containing protein X-domain domain-containing protein n=1 Tax=Hermanssonia centrifuga TaxID=98765 RepID=A0A4S4KQQ2_9APHY|nr:hypothetical protein EW026_g1969 [Hermanssonia centrifuga]
MADKEGAVNMEDAAGFFANVFGGERFVDYIGEISLMKEMTSVASTMMSEEEKTEIEKEMNEGRGSSTPASASVNETSMPGPASPTTGSTPLKGASNGSTSHSTALMTSPLPSPGENNEHKGVGASTKEGKEKKRSKLTPEQKKKLQELEDERRKNMEERVTMLTKKLIERLRPFVEAKHPGDKDDPETKSFEARIRREADDLKLESFGVELLQTIGNVYMMKATTFLKSKKFLGIPGFFSRLKEKGSVAKEAWGVIGSAIGVQTMMQEMEKMQEKGEIDEAQLRALEEDVTGKIMLASWRGTRFEVVNVLREVVDKVLKEPGVSDQVLYNRAKGLLFIGAMFKTTVPDESDEDRRTLERMVAEAASGKSKHHQLQAEARAAARHRKAAGSPAAAQDKAEEVPVAAAS